MDVIAPIFQLEVAVMLDSVGYLTIWSLVWGSYYSLRQGQTFGEFFMGVGFMA